MRRAKQICSLLTLALLLICSVLLFVPLPMQVEAQSVGGKISNSRTVCIKAGGKLIGPINVPSNIPANRLVATPEIAGYGGAGETAAFQFNGDPGNNYSVFWLTAAPAGTTFAAGTNTAAATDRIRIGPANTNQQRIVSATIFDNSAKTEHMVVFDSATGTGTTANSNIDLGNGKWVSSVATAITSISLITTTDNMGAGSCLTVSW